MHYVLHFPKGEKYVSILKQCDDGEDQERLEAERDRLMKLVQKQLAEEALVAEADEGKSLVEKHKKLDNTKKERGGDEENGDVDDDFFLNSDKSDDEDNTNSEEEKDAMMDGGPSSSEEEKEEEEEEDVHMAKVAKPRQTNGFNSKDRGRVRGGAGYPPPPSPSGRGRKDRKSMDNMGRKPSIKRKPIAHPSSVVGGVKKQNKPLSGDKKRLGKVRGSVEKVPVRKRAEGGRKRRKGK